MFTLNRVPSLTWGGECVTNASVQKRTPIKLLSLILSLTLLFSVIPITSFANQYTFTYYTLYFDVVGSRYDGTYGTIHYRLLDTGMTKYSTSIGSLYDNKNVSTRISDNISSTFKDKEWRVLTPNSLNDATMQMYEIDSMVICVKQPTGFNDPAIDSNNAQTVTLTNALNTQTTTLAGAMASQTNNFNAKIDGKATELLYVSNSNKTILSQLGIPLTATSGGVYTTSGGVRVQVILYSPPTNLDQLSLS